MDLFKLITDYPYYMEYNSTVLTISNLPIGLEEDFTVDQVSHIITNQNSEKQNVTIVLYEPLHKDLFISIYSLIYRWTQFHGDDRDFLRLHN